jgi:hypothetical protein
MTTMNTETRLTKRESASVAVYLRQGSKSESQIHAFAGCPQKTLLDWRFAPR